MSIVEDAPRGGVVESVAGGDRVLMLRLGEIERFEDKHYGVFTLYDRLMGNLDPKPTAGEVRDLIALGLVGGGLSEKESATIMGAVTPADLWGLYATAINLLGVALFPDVVDAPPPSEEGADAEKKPEAG